MENFISPRKLSTQDDCMEAETLLQPSKNQVIVSQKHGYHVQQSLTETTTKQHQNLSTTRFKVMRVTLYILHKTLNIVYVPLFVYRAFTKTRKCTAVTDELLMIPVSQLTKKIRKKEISCEKVIRSYITRIKEVNPLLNALIDERFSEAIEDAIKVDQLVASEEFQNNEENLMRQYPLLGVPLTVKGSISVKGLKFTSGLVTRKEMIAENDAVAVELARKAGAIPLLVSNVPELCMNWETSNKLIGTTNNPYDSTRTCGGSSGGEASLLGAGASLIGIGSDIAGSLRLPAHNCGVWGHKPSPGVVSYVGHYPSCADHQKWEAFFALGPIARYAGDLRPLLDVISKPEERQRLNLGEKIDVKELKVYYTDMKNFFWKEPSEPCIEATQKVVDYFRTICDTPPKKVSFELFQYATELATFTLLDIDNVDNIFDNDCNGLYAELFRYMTFRSKHTLSTLGYGLLRRVINTRTSKRFKQKIRDNLAALKNEFEETLGEKGVFVIPSFPVEAIKHGDWLRLALASGYMSIFNALGFPVTNCPVDFTKDGIPIGIQVASLPYSDNLTLTAAEKIEEVFGGWKSPNSQ